MRKPEWKSSSTSTKIRFHCRARNLLKAPCQLTKKNRQIMKSLSRNGTQETFVFPTKEIATRMLDRVKVSACRTAVAPSESKHLTLAPLQTSKCMKCAKAHNKTDHYTSIAATSLPQMNYPFSGVSLEPVRGMTTQMKRMTGTRPFAIAPTLRIVYLTAMSSRSAPITASQSQIRRARDKPI